MGSGAPGTTDQTLPTCPFLPSEHSVTWRLGMARAARGWFHRSPGDLRSLSYLRPVPVAWSSPEQPGGRWGPASLWLQLPQPSGSGHREGAGSAGCPSVGLGPDSGSNGALGA